MLIDYILHGRSHLGEELRRRLLLNLLPRPLLILQVQLDLALVHCPSINGTNPEGETSNTCAGDKGKQTNKQVEAAHAEAWMQGAVQSCITCRVQYAVCQSTWKSFRDASEMHWKSAEFDMQGCTLTQIPKSVKYFFSMMRSEHHTGMHSFHNILISKSALVFLEQLQGRIPFLISHHSGKYSL